MIIKNIINRLKRIFKYIIHGNVYKRSERGYYFLQTISTDFRTINPRDVPYINQIPKIVHRTLLFDKHIQEREYHFVKGFYSMSKEYIHMLWTEKDVLEIMNEQEKKQYLEYEHKIQKADFARYVIVNKMGGVYADLDVEIKTSLSRILSDCTSATVLLDEYVDATLSIQENNHPIRKLLPESEKLEVLPRIANFFFASKANDSYWKLVFQLCEQRKALPIKENYDILVTTGPDVVSVAFHRATKGTCIIPTKKAKYITHHCANHWLKNQW